MATEIVVTDHFEAWYSSLSATEQKAIIRVVDQLEELGPLLGSPQSSAIKGSRIALRELRVQHMGHPYRILYAFDPTRQAVLLLGGNKVGKGNHCYESAIRLAERPFTEYLDSI